MEPKIRLKGFSGDWEKTTIGDVASVVGGGTPSTSNPLYWNGQIQWFTPTEVGHIKYVEKSERTITTEGIENSSARIIPANSLLLSSRATIGEASINLCDCTTNQGFQSLIPNNIDLEFLYSLMITKKNDLIRESNGSTFLEISANKVRSIGICIPEREEQKSLGGYFQHLDTLIQSTSKKIASLKQVKTACLQSMFPQEGETAPRVRFKGFEEPWEEVEIKDIASFSKGHGYSKSDLRSSGNPIILYGRMYTKYETSISGVDTFVSPAPNSVYSTGNEVIMPASGETPEDISCASAVLAKGVILGGDLNVLRFDMDKYNTTFMALSLSSGKAKKELSNMAQGKSVVHLHNSDIEKISLLMPSYEEQNAIASYFTSLDSQITLQTQRLEKLKQVKSACLDNMFV